MLLPGQEELVSTAGASGEQEAQESPVLGP